MAHRMSALPSWALLGLSMISVPGTTSRPGALSAKDWLGRARSMLKNIVPPRNTPKERKGCSFIWISVLGVCYLSSRTAQPSVGNPGKAVGCTDYRGLALSMLLGGQVPPQVPLPLSAKQLVPEELFAVRDLWFTIWCSAVGQSRLRISAMYLPADRNWAFYVGTTGYCSTAFLLENIN